MDGIEERDVEKPYRTAFIAAALAPYSVFFRCLAEFVTGFFKELCVFFYNSMHSDDTFLRTVGKKNSRGLYGLVGLFVNKKHH
jgi:hypothetical protein